MLTTAQQATLVAAMDRIVPADDYPSASQANVGVFIERLIATDLRHRAAELASLLDAIDAAARTAHRLAFAILSADQQDQLLTSIESSGESRVRRGFGWLVEMVNEGYYADPANGGNKDAVSWRMVGYDPKVPGYDGGIAVGKQIATERQR